ncbi:hypothetical protein SEVIR_2G039700v4 [Setaria viridis]|uniref:Uncharacterized protein n=1 Tax=Setaria viridis TaxID=4556 RepID=A0A4U6VLA8_SETVI|nr:hypothetical protein SEVIR_2G039700v2 [Setaria viridis]
MPSSSPPGSAAMPDAGVAQGLPDATASLERTGAAAAAAGRGAERRDDDREAERLDGSSCFRLRCFVHRPAQRKGEQGGELLEAWIWLQALLPSADPSAFRSATPVHLKNYMASVLASLNASAALLVYFNITDANNTE